MSDIAEKIEVEVTGKVIGFRFEDEDIDDARARLVLDAEILSNENCKQRLHLSIKDPEKYYKGFLKPSSDRDELRSSNAHGEQTGSH